MRTLRSAFSSCLSLALPDEKSKRLVFPTGIGAGLRLTMLSWMRLRVGAQRLLHNGVARIAEEVKL